MQRTRIGRSAALCAGVALVVLWGSGPATGAPWDGPGGGGLSIRGAAASQGEGGEYGLGVFARTTGDAEDAEGQFRFGQKGADGERGMAGSVHCLSRDAAGLIQVSGSIFGSGGEDAAGQDFAATIDADSEPQRFSTVRVGEPGTIAPCSGGEPEFHTVTEGGYTVTGGR